MSAFSSEIKGNVATIHGARSYAQTVYVTTNAKVTQHVTLKVDDTEHVFTGTGEGGTIIGQIVLPFSFKTLQITSRYKSDGKLVDSAHVYVGDPVVVGRASIFAVVVENGDDEDYNDAILNFLGRYLG